VTLRARWVTLTSRETDAIVINTCGFVEEAKNESLEAIMQAIQKKNEGKTKRVVITV
jgi:ribosomal protein S12 methylthiotransferase